jgi:hypothetical protein
MQYKIFQSKNYKFFIFNQFNRNFFSFILFFLTIISQKFLKFCINFFSFSNFVVVIVSNNQILKKFLEQKIFILIQFFLNFKIFNKKLFFKNLIDTFLINLKINIIFNQISKRKTFENIILRKKKNFKDFLLFFFEILNKSKSEIKKKKSNIVIKNFLILINFFANFFFFSKKKAILKNFFFFVRSFYYTILKKNKFIFFLIFVLIRNKKVKHFCFLIGIMFILFKKHLKRIMLKNILKTLQDLNNLKLDKIKRDLIAKKNKINLIIIKKNQLKLEMGKLYEDEITFYFFKTNVKFSVFIMACFFIANNLKKKIIFRIFQWLLKHKNKIFSENSLFAIGFFFF